MKLSEARCLFSKVLANHLVWLTSIGQNYALDEGIDRLTEKDPTSDHMKNSNHDIGLAQDIVFYDENFQPMIRTEDHATSGVMWETRHPLCRWGGRFSDGGHYSFEWKGRK